MPNLLDRARSKIFYEVVDGKKVFIGGLKPDTRDDRDLQVGGILGWLGLDGYTPKHTRFRLPIVISNQSAHNTCGWISVKTNKQLQEKVDLSGKGLVKIAKREGLLTQNGFSQLRDNMKVIKSFGIPEQRFVEGNEVDDNWESFSENNLSQEALDNAATHRSASYASTREYANRNDTLRAIDEGLSVHSGAPWYSGFNMRGGFSSPYLITKAEGYLIGGHAFEIAGYDLDFMGTGRKVYVCPNTYGTGWGDNGWFYVDMDFADKFFYSRWTQLDIPVDTARFLQSYNGLNVKAKGKPGVYWIADGAKTVYPDWLTFLAMGGLKSEIITLDGEEASILESLTLAGKVDITVSPYWSLIKEMAAPDNYKKLIELTSVSGWVGMAGDTMNEIFEEIYSCKS